MRVTFHENGKVTIDRDGKTILMGESRNHLICVDFIINKNCVIEQVLIKIHN